jgi:uncharacterized protein (DUF2141 family)
MEDQILIERLNGFEKLTEERFKSTAMALSLQAEENKRRLADLTVETDRLRQMQSGFVSMPVFESYKREINIIMSALEKKSNEETGKEKGSHDTIAWIIAAISIAMAVISFLLRMK